MNEQELNTMIKQSKHALYEGAWGYNPEQSDDYLDECAVVGRQILEIIVGNFEKAINEKDYQNVWNYMGIIIDYLRTENLTGECMYWEEKDEMYTIINQGTDHEEKRLNYGVKINQLYKQAYDMLNNEENLLDYNDYSKFKKQLDGIKNQFTKMMFERKSNEFGKDSWHAKIDKIRQYRDRLFYKYIEKKTD